MKRILLSLLLAYLFSSTEGLAYESKMTSREATMFYRELQEQLANDENRLTADMRQIKIWEGHKFQNQMDVYNTKKILYKNFYNTPSVESSSVRKKLVQLFKSSTITEKDLSELQQIVNKEKAKH